MYAFNATAISPSDNQGGFVETPHIRKPIVPSCHIKVCVRRPIYHIFLSKSLNAMSRRCTYVNGAETHWLSTLATMFYHVQFYSMIRYDTASTWRSSDIADLSSCQCGAGAIVCRSPHVQNAANVSAKIPIRRQAINTMGAAILPDK